MTARVLIPVLLDLTGLRILFVGGGTGARTKLASLVDQDPAVRIVAPEIDPEVEAFCSRLTDVEYHLRAFTEADLDGISLVYGFTDDPEVNAGLAELCRRRGLWSNIAQNRGPFSFTSPAIGRKDGVVAAFSSESGHPAVAVAVRDAWVEGEE